MSKSWNHKNYIRNRDKQKKNREQQLEGFEEEVIGDYDV
jgi:hypothetical protein